MVMTMSREIISFEPAIIAQVRKSGDIYVGRTHVGKTAHIYFEKKHVQNGDDERDEERDTEELE